MASPVPERTIREHLHRRGLHRAALAGQPRAFGRYEAERPNERWMGDVLVGPFVPLPRVAGTSVPIYSCSWMTSVDSSSMAAG